MYSARPALVAPCLSFVKNYGCFNFKRVIYLCQLRTPHDKKKTTVYKDNSRHKSVEYYINFYAVLS